MTSKGRYIDVDATPRYFKDVSAGLDNNFTTSWVNEAAIYMI